ncbi:hypothetical protein [Phaeovulum veldkampii]|uniref:hypothetical protein n=1 Tax=Phaeovulum veldkampii TaxID=33049 RepID=UPI00145604AA|nr:hypothetical protein [Phaeovulum veldkampii]
MQGDGVLQALLDARNLITARAKDLISFAAHYVIKGAAQNRDKTEPPPAPRPSAP